MTIMPTLELPLGNVTEMYGKAAGSKVHVIADILKHTLSFQVHVAGKAEPEGVVEVPQKECCLPSRLKPWVMLGHPGDSVTISDVTELS